MNKECPTRHMSVKWVELIAPKEGLCHLSNDREVCFLYSCNLIRCRNGDSIDIDGETCSDWVYGLGDCVDTYDWYACCQEDCPRALRGMILEFLSPSATTVEVFSNPLVTPLLEDLAKAALEQRQYNALRDALAEVGIDVGNWKENKARAVAGAIARRDWPFDDEWYIIKKSSKPSPPKYFINLNTGEELFGVNAPEGYRLFDFVDKEEIWTALRAKNKG